MRYYSCKLFCIPFLLLGKHSFSNGVISFLLWSITDPTSSGELTEVFSKSEEHELAENSLVTTFDQGKSWKISFELNPGTEWPKQQTQNIFQLTTGDRGSRSPSLFLLSGKGKGWSIITNVNGNPNHKKILNKQDRPPLNEWTELVFEQREDAGGEFVFAFSQGGVEKYSVTNNDPQEFPNVKVTFNRTSAAPLLLFRIELIEGKILWAFLLVFNMANI